MKVANVSQSPKTGLLLRPYFGELGSRIKNCDLVAVGLQGQSRR
jgi:hypothetical protein